MRQLPPRKKAPMHQEAGWEISPYFRAVCIYLLISLLGIAIAAGAGPGAGMAGALTILAGVGGCAWTATKWAREWRRGQEMARLAQARSAQRAVRRSRQTQAKEQRQRSKQTQLSAMRRQEQQRQAERQTRSERAERMEAQRLARFETVTREATRLQALSDAHLLAELPALFAARGLRLQTDTSHEPEDMTFLRLEDESREVARLVPQGQTIAVADVEALEQWRLTAEATHAYLIGRNGFSHAALRLAPRFPITLVEPQLLAQWHVTAMQAGIS